MSSNATSKQATTNHGTHPVWRLGPVETKVPAGLRWVPSFQDERLNREDYVAIEGYSIQAPQHFTELNHQALAYAMEWAFENESIQPYTVLEIGMHRPRQASQTSSTTTILSGLVEPDHYIGVDPRDVNLSRLLDDCLVGRRVVARHVRCRSDERDKVMEALGGRNITVLMIDGDHSVEAVVNDWRYTEHLSAGGVVVMHDTNTHPGPRLVFDAVDPRLYSKILWGVGAGDDYGIGVLLRR